MPCRGDAGFTRVSVWVVTFYTSQTPKAKQALEEHHPGFVSENP
jgi:hypothetical protein